VNPWCQLCERLVKVADADIACQEILQVFYQLQEDKDAWTPEVGSTTVCPVYAGTVQLPLAWHP